MLDFLINLFIIASIFAIVASSLNLLIGFTGVFSIAHAIFYGVGGYAAALVSLHLGTSLLLALLIAMVASAVFSVLLALPAARVTGEYFVVVSLAFALVAFTVFSQWTPVTGGPAGLVGISRVTLLGIPLDSNKAYLGLAVVMLVLVTVILYVIIRRTPLGRSLQALRDDPLAAQALGKNSFRLRLIAVVISSALAATGGVIYAGYVFFVNADSFSVHAGVLFMTMVILGGAGTLSGPIIGAFFITLFPEALEFADLPSELKGPLEQIIYGAALVVLMLVRPSGLAGMFTDLLPQKRRSAGLLSAGSESQPAAGGPVADKYTSSRGTA